MILRLVHTFCESFHQGGIEVSQGIAPAVFFKLFLLFVLTPLVELTLLLALADYTDWWVSLLAVILSGLGGAMLARRQGWQTFRRIREDLQAGRPPTDSLLDALMILVAGALLLTPGLLTDAFGLSMLIPACRAGYKRKLTAWFKSRFSLRYVDEAAPAEKSEVIDSYVVESPPSEKTN